MKLQELGLKSKPQTKYFEGGYVSFMTREGELFFKVIVLDNDRNPFPLWETLPVTDKEHLDKLMSIKSRMEFITND